MELVLPDDLEYLRSRIAGRRRNQPHLSDANLRYVSVITSRNAQRDKLNDMAYRRFADEVDQPLHFFHLSKEWGNEADPDETSRTNEKIGMPVMLKHNEATELSLTNGQEAQVVGWQSVQDSQKREYLETLFVKLINPPKSVQLENLPLNVVPIPRTSVTVPARFFKDRL